jgi:hypothetical protein
MTGPRAVGSLLRRAGFEPLPGGAPSGVVPPHAVGRLTSCGIDDGLVDAVQVDDGDPSVDERVGQEWFRLAARYGLFDGAGEFLLAVSADDATGVAWLRVRLLETWNLMRVAGAVTGTERRGRPELRMLSLDGQVSTGVTTSQDGVEILVLLGPGHAPTIRDQMNRRVERADGQAHRLVGSWEDPEKDRAIANAWLAYLNGSG